MQADERRELTVANLNGVPPAWSIFRHSVASVSGQLAKLPAHGEGMLPGETPIPKRRAKGH